ncbi:MAG: SDR family oxidoreductase [Cytophagales bacterium]|nr:MAG: SDR family oxidoreductase [Cytophagales bacterium]TAH29281.1 MAG: SDR family oxidoreductase [Cytophagales bacterium]
MMKTVLITGASSGIGKATAVYFQQKGWQVIATMRNPTNEKELNTLKNVQVLQLDVTDEKSIENAVKKSLELFGNIDVVINNAGYGTLGAFEAATSEQIKRQFDTNLFGLMSVTKAFLPHFRSKKSGLFINISSIGGTMTFPLFSLYHATKWALEGFSESLNFELRELGIGVKIVEPGGVKTDFAGRSLDWLINPELTDYNTTIEKIQKVFSNPEIANNYSEAAQIAAVIFEAATDDKKQVRYLAGVDAIQLFETRKNLGNEDFITMMKTNFLG